MVSNGNHRGSPQGISGTGIGLRLCHLDTILADLPEVPWLEVLADNHLVGGGPLIDKLDQVRRQYPLTLHCVGMSLGGTDDLDKDYLSAIKNLADRLDIDVISDHLCFTQHNGQHFPDLLPLPYTEEALSHVVSRVGQIQDYLRRPLLVENVSAYLRYQHSSIPEGEFLSALASRCGCGLLVDVNNAYVNEVNLGTPVGELLAALPASHVAQAHLAGYDDRGTYLLDAHNNPVSEPVWQWYATFVRMFPGVPTTIEWDNEIPPMDALLAECNKANEIIHETTPIALSAAT